MEAAKHYWRSNLLYIGRAHPNELVDKFLPGLLYINAVSLLDDALSLWMDCAGLKLAKPYRDDLNGRIEFLADSGRLPDPGPLHAIRKRRNALAHEPDSFCTWADLEKDTGKIEAALLQFNLVTKSKKLEFFYERSGMYPSEEPDVAFTRRLAYGVKEDGEIALQVTWEEKVYKVG